MGTFVAVENFPSAVTTQPGLIQVQGGQLGLQEYGEVTGDYGATPAQLWDIFPARPNRYIINPDVNTVPFNIQLPEIDNSNYQRAHDGNLIYIFNAGAIQAITLYNFGGAAIIAPFIAPGEFVEVSAQLGYADDWIIIDQTPTPPPPPTPVDLQTAYNNSTSPEIKLDLIRLALTLYGNDLNTVPILFDVTGNNGAGAVAGRYFAVWNTDLGFSTSSAITGLGNTGTPTGLNSIALGPGSSANQAYAFAFGLNATVGGDYGISFGANSFAADLSVAIGGGAGFFSGAFAGIINNIAIGSFAWSNNFDATAVGTASRAEGVNGVAYGARAHALEVDTTSLGPDTVADMPNATAVGARASANEEFATSVGADSLATAPNSVAVGPRADSSALNSSAIGPDSLANQPNATAVGPHAQARGPDATAVGSFVEATASAAVGLGGSETGPITSAQAGTLVAADGAATTTNTADGITPTNKAVLFYQNGIQVLGDANNSASRIFPGTANNTPSYRIFQAQGLTTTNTFATIMTIPTLSNSITNIELRMTVVRTGGAGSPGDSYYIVIMAKAKNISGTVTISSMVTNQILDTVGANNGVFTQLVAASPILIQGRSGTNVRNLTWNVTAILSELNY